MSKRYFIKVDEHYVRVDKELTTVTYVRETREATPFDTLKALVAAAEYMRLPGYDAVEA